MNVEEAVRRLNGYLQRRGKVDGSGGWTEQWLLDVLTDANLDMYHRVVSYGPEIFQKVSRFTYAQDSDSIDLNAALSGMPAAIWYIGTLSKDEDIGPNNIPSPIDMVRRTNLDSGALSGAGISSTSNIPNVSGTFTLDVFSNAHSSFQGFFLGNELSIRPIPRSDLFMYMRWTPDKPQDLTDKDQNILGGFLPQFHTAIVYKAAIAAKSAKGEETTHLERLYMDIVGQYDSNLKMGCKQRQRQQPQQRDQMRWEY